MVSLLKSCVELFSVRFLEFEFREANVICMMRNYLDGADQRL